MSENLLKVEFQLKFCLKKLALLCRYCDWDYQVAKKAMFSSVLPLNLRVKHCFLGDLIVSITWYLCNSASFSRQNFNWILTFGPFSATFAAIFFYFYYVHYFWYVLSLILVKNCLKTNQKLVKIQARLTFMTAAGWLLLLYFVKSPKLETKSLLLLTKASLCVNHPIDFQEGIFTYSWKEKIGKMRSDKEKIESLITGKTF